ncbi:MAG: hypothetical protein AAF226_00785 [Verrucomicrobiota bacterium]
MMKVIWGIWMAVMLSVMPSLAADKEILVVVGLEGAEEYDGVFEKLAERWKLASDSVGVPCEIIGVTAEEGESVRDRVKNRLAQKAEGELWLVMLGHGTFDGRTAKFNVAGPDITAGDLAEWLNPRQDESTVVMNFFSASAPFLTTLSGENRIVISATKSASEVFYSRFGSFFTTALIEQPEADLDNDDQVSVLEAFIMAGSQVSEFFENQGRLATEHAMLDDNGDTLGTRADWFQGTTAIKTAKDGAELDGFRAGQRVLIPNSLERKMTSDQLTRRNELELSIRDLREAKSDYDEAAYYEKMESLLLELARIYSAVPAQ